MADPEDVPKAQTPAEPTAKVPPAPPSRWAHLLDQCKWPAALVAIALMGLFAYLQTLKQTQKAAENVGRGVAAAVDTAREIASRFATGQITETFTAAIPELSSDGMTLEVAKAEATEIFGRSDSRNTLWNMFYIGTTTTEIRVPVTYRYHIDLSGPWHLDVSGQTCIVRAPVFEPSLPPAIHTDRMQKYSERGWARFNESQQMDELERSITPTLNRYAGDHRHREMVREHARKAVAEFVQLWLMREDQWRNDRFHTIKVIFPDEEDYNPEEFVPTVSLESR